MIAITFTHNAPRCAGRARLALLAILVSVAGACERTERESAAVDQREVLQSLPPAPDVRIADLRWLLGTWRGSGEGDTFYEEYRALDDSTFVIVYFTDSTMTEVEPIGGSVEERDGRIHHSQGESRWVATEGSASSLTFSPVQGTTNRFRWSSGSPDRWTATLMETGENGREVTHTYVMERVPAVPRAETP